MLLAVATCITLLCAPPAETVKAVEVTAAEALSKVPGKSAFAFTEIDSKGVQPLFGIHADKRFAVGSSFKLFILGTLIEDVNAQRRRLSDTMRLERRLQGPPHSEMAEWPVGMPVTLNTLALKMIWISDNTATDHLLFLLGREAIERQMEAMGHSDPAVNRPLLSTREMTLLRDKKQGLPGRTYQKLTLNERRRYLDSHFQGVPDYERLDFDTAAYDVAEWYASPLDMAKALAWIHHHTAEGELARPLLDVLAVDPKLTLDKKVWPFVGFKGGSEDQLIAGNWLLRHRNGKWYTFHVYFNNPNGPVKPEQVLPAIEQILAAIEPTLSAARR